MNTTLNEDGQHRLAEARQSYSGSRLTDTQFDEAWNIAGIINREIHRSGSFIKKLSNYAEVFADDRKFDVTRAENILRDIFRSRYGESMNQLREELMAAEENLRSLPLEHALPHARTAVQLIQESPTMPAYQAIDRASVGMARQNGVTEYAAQKMMSEAYKAAEGRSLREACKELRQPDRQAARAERKAERVQIQRSGPSR